MSINQYIRVASAVPQVTLADPSANAAHITALCKKMDKAGVDVAVFPEMCITGYTCGDLFFNNELLESAKNALNKLVNESRKLNLVFIVGLPVAINNNIYNVAAVIHKGTLAGLVPKTYIPNYNEFYEKRWWQSGHDVNLLTTEFTGQPVLLSSRQLFRCKDTLFGIEICEDLWTPIPPSTHAALAGAEVMFNLSATDILAGKYDYIRHLVVSQSARCIGAYVYASAGQGESSTDLVFDGISLIAENGKIVAESERWQITPHYRTFDIDLEAIRKDRRKMTSFGDCARNNNTNSYHIVELAGQPNKKPTERVYSAVPFLPRHSSQDSRRFKEIVDIQCAALAQRLKATKCNNVVIGVSGGLDSTLALLVATRTFDNIGLNRKGIHAITLPGFGTSDRTYRNAVRLIATLDTSFREISIVDAVNLHFRDIGHNEALKDTTYENAQARQRTLILMDVANQVGGFVLGTGDMSELALGWATYNGDHMSMYGVNAGVPKTLVRYLVERFTDTSSPLINTRNDAEFRYLLRDILDTPISPELIPTDTDGNISQRTEDLVGPYILHDFFLFYTLRYGLSPEHIFERAQRTFAEDFEPIVILKWLKIFYKRFFSQQFKRSCMPDGPKVGSVCLSPRGDWRMPSDANSDAWIKSIEKIEKKLTSKR